MAAGVSLCSRKVEMFLSMVLSYLLPSKESLPLVELRVELELQCIFLSQIDLLCDSLI